MDRRPILCAVTALLAGATPLFASDRTSAASVQPESDLSSAKFYESLTEEEGEWISDRQFQLASMESGCGDSVLGCGDCCGECGNATHDGCVDRFLPRSNLPLPLLKDLAGDHASMLPLPLGTGVIFTELNRNVAVSDVRLALGAATPVSVDRVNVPTTTFHASSQIARVDLWVLPCANVYGIVGHTRSTGDVAVTIDNFPLPTSSPVTLNIPVDLEGTTGGFGVTSAIGGENWFASLDVNQSWTNFSNLDASLTALVISPRVGVPIDRRFFQGEVHVGAMWQDTAQTVRLTVDHAILGNDLHIEVDQFEPDPWNFLVGALWAVDERLHVIVEGGMGGRDYILTSLTLRY